MSQTTEEPTRRSFFSELKRRKVVRVAIAYLAVSMWMLDSSERVFEVFQLGDELHRIMVIAAVAGLPLVLVLSWLFDLTRKGIVKTPAKAADAQTGSDGDGAPRFTRQLVMASVAVVLATTAVGWYYMPDDRPELIEGRVAVEPFVNTSGDPELESQGYIMADGLRRNLIGIEGLDVVPYEPLAAQTLLMAAGDGENEIVSPTQMLAERGKAALVITGSYYPAGEDIVFQASVYDANEARIIFPADPVRVDAADPTLALPLLQEELFGFMAGLGGGGPLTEASSFRQAAHLPNYAAYKQYSLALELIANRWGERDAQLAHLDSAMSLDSTFTGAMTLAAMLRDMYNRPGAQELLDRVEARRADLTPYERAGLDRVQAQIDHDLDGLYRHSAQVAELVGTPMSYYMAGVAALDVNRPIEALDHFLDFDEDRLPTRQIWRARAETYHYLGRHRTELRVVREARELMPVDEAWVFRRWEWAAFAARGEGDVVLEDFARGMPADVALDAADELEVHGHPETARLLRERLLERHDALPDDQRPRGYLLDRGRVLAALDRHDEAKAVFDGMIEADTNDRNARVFAALAAIELGDRTYAEETIQWMAERDHLFAQARIAGSLGDAERVVELLRQDENAGNTHFRDLHADPAFAPILEHPTFQEYMKPRDEETGLIGWLPGFLRRG